MTESNYKLVDSTYEAEDARKVLLGIIKDKVNSIQRTCFGLEERHCDSAEEIAHFKTRLVELEATQEEIIRLTKEAAKNNWKLKIDAQIKVEVLSEELVG